MGKGCASMGTAFPTKLYGPPSAPLALKGYESPAAERLSPTATFWPNATAYTCESGSCPFFSLLYPLACSCPVTPARKASPYVLLVERTNFLESAVFASGFGAFFLDAPLAACFTARDSPLACRGGPDYQGWAKNRGTQRLRRNVLCRWLRSIGCSVRVGFAEARPVRVHAGRRHPT